MNLGNLDLSNSTTYSEYFEEFKKKAEITDESLLTESEKEKLPNVKMNFQRSSRIHRTYNVDESVKESTAKITSKQIWLIITESWCGDSAQNVPYIVEISKLNPLIEVKILPRDINLPVMDLYLTNGTRSIPKLIVFDDSGDELFQWGPRPKEAQELVTQLKEEGKTKEEFLAQLHLWYGRNRGKVLESELKTLIGELDLTSQN